MARYDREFLVPYLRDVCALEMAAQRLDGRQFQLVQREIRLNASVDNSPPERPEIIPVRSCGGFSAARIGGFCSLLGLVFQSPLLVLLGLVPLVAGLGSCYQLAQNNKAKEEKYNRELQAFEEAEQKRKNYRAQKMPPIKREQNLCSSERKKVNANLQRVYGVNIIPSHYRNIYVAVYLYDWFSTSQSDDLDMALSMFVLEEIKSRLDQIIANQTEIILNQYTMISDQRRFQEEQRVHNQRLMARLDQICASNDERNAYLRMIESHNATTAYFAAADYIRKI